MNAEQIRLGWKEREKKIRKRNDVIDTIMPNCLLMASWLQYEINSITCILALMSVPVFN